MGRPNDDNDDTRRVSDSDRQQARRRLEEVGHDATLADSSASQPGRGAFASAATSATDLASGPTHTPGALPGVPEKDLAAGDQVGEYVVEAQIGRGGFGTVYRAVQPLIGKRVAIKVLSRKYSADSEIVSRFVAEARAVNQIRHRHIIDIFSFGQLPDGRHYYVMELLEGDPLDHYLAVRGPLPLLQALPILRSIARALDAAHAKGIAHRDLKPENIFIAQDTDGQGTEVWPKLLDFGIAKLMGPDDAMSHRTGTGVPIGTPYYMSPEQCRGRDVDHRTDIYSFGILTYRMLTGTYPFEGEIVEILHKQMHEAAEPASKRNPSLSPEVDQALEWMMQKNPEHRPRSVIAAVVALQDDKTPTPMLTSSAVRGLVSPVSVIGRAPRRRAIWMIPALAALVIGGGVAAFVAMRANRSPPDRPVAAAPVAPKPAVAAVVPPTPDVPAVGVASVDAGASAVEPVPELVTIRVLDVPPGTEVLLAGDVIGVAPAPVQLRRGDKPVTLLFRADRYQSQSKPVVPDQDQDLKVGLKKKRVAPRPDDPPNTDALADPFGKKQQ